MNDPSIELLKAIVAAQEKLQEQLESLASMISQGYEYTMAAIGQVAAQLPPPPLSQAEAAAQAKVTQMVEQGIIPRDPIVIERTYQHLLQSAVEKETPDPEANIAQLQAIMAGEEE